MKDIVVTASRLRRERNVYLVCFLLAFLLNLVAVVSFDRPWIELFSQLGYVVVISVVLYLLLWIFRLLAAGVRRVFCKKR